jgi:outer membrane biosynthesis protein TonB
LFLFWFLGSITPDIPKPVKEKKIKISLKELPKSNKPKVKQKKPIEQKKSIEPKAEPMFKGSQLKEIEKSLVKLKPKPKSKKTKLNTKKKIQKKKPKPKPKIKPLPPQKPYIPLVKEKRRKIKKEEKSKDELAWLEEDMSAQEEKDPNTKNKDRGASLGSKNLKKLYGSKWGKLTPGQKKYMLDNQEIMRRITQEILNRQARVSDINNLNVNRTNIIEFKLHPNGDMSDFKFLNKSGYYILDDITKATIGYAYSKYPRPKEVIIVRYNVFYNLARY